MSQMPADLEEHRLKKMLADVYQATKYCFFSDDVVPKVMENMSLSEGETIELLKTFISRGWLNTKGFKPGFFLRPGFVCGFPVIITSLGLETIREKG